MKILVIADLHWKDVWKDMVENLTFDKVVFLWDYMDSFTIKDKQMITNLREIIQYKRENIDNTILLLGNHDVQYIWEWNQCSWYRPSIAAAAKIIFENDIKFFKICHEEEGYLFSHAGFTKWWEKHNEADIDNLYPDGFYSYEQLNAFLFTHWNKMFFQCWRSRGWGDKFSWPLWADRSETMEDWIDSTGLIQVVWHTPVPKKVILPHIIYCDCLENWDGKPLLIDTLKKRKGQEMKEVIYTYQRFWNWYYWITKLPDYLDEKEEVMKKEMTNKIIILWVYQIDTKSE